MNGKQARRLRKISRHVGKEKKILYRGFKMLSHVEKQLFLSGYLQLLRRGGSDK